MRKRARGPWRRGVKSKDSGARGRCSAIGGIQSLRCVQPSLLTDGNPPSPAGEMSNHLRATEPQTTIYFSDTGDLKDAVWLPKSQADDGGDGEAGKICEFLVPEWLANTKGLI